MKLIENIGAGVPALVSYNKYNCDTISTSSLLSLLIMNGAFRLLCKSLNLVPANSNQLKLTTQVRNLPPFEQKSLVQRLYESVSPLKFFISSFPTPTSHGTGNGVFRPNIMAIYAPKSKLLEASPIQLSQIRTKTEYNIKYSWAKGKRRTNKDVIARFKRLPW